MAGKDLLDRISEELGKNFSEEKVHTAMLLSFVSSLYTVVRRDCTPSPLYRVGYDKTNNIITMKETAGHSNTPDKTSIDITDLDILLMGDLREIPILIEGETGIGKTFVSQRYLSTVLAEGEYFSHRLSSNAFMSNMFQHFQEGKMQNGMPVIEAKLDKIETTAAGIVDEINRGDPNETLQLFDNEMHLNGTIYKLGIPIPEIKNQKYNPKSGRKKKMFLVSAQNPASSDDAKFTGTMQLDAAVDNRLLKVYMSNAAPSAGSTLWLAEAKGKRHELFLQDFKRRVSKYLGLEEKVLQAENNWLSTYAWITDSAKTDKPVLYSALEISDFMISIFSGNLINYYNYEKSIIKSWSDQLGLDIEIKDSLTETEKIKKINEVTNSFKAPIIFRDIVQIKRVSDVLATLKNIKDALKSKDPMDYYLKAKKYVTVREVSEATALVTRNKQKANSPSPVNVINEILTQYCGLTEEYMKETKHLRPVFDIYDFQGIKNTAVFNALRENITGRGNISTLIGRIADHAKKLTSKISTSEEIKNVMIARSTGDLLTLCGFLNEYKDELENYKDDASDKIPAIKKYTKQTDTGKLFEAIGRFYCLKQKENSVALADIYQHRIQRTMGRENSC